ncbi:MAG: exopolyphosphatase [Steroidobacteraceae bacterium]|nr:exopolyphosphatase [Steroidobacteraceae bacterium]MDW8258781.1 exopolyphosphatase [Gammaproteobacteria bacterium]
MRQRAPDLLAAVDLGSNSFHLVVARLQHGQLVVVDRMREGVRLASGMSADGQLDRETAARALACLERFGQRLRAMQPGTVRVVGTNALRRAHRKRGFLTKAREAIGHPIEIVSGIEEARLIYSGVVHTMPAFPGRRLVVDIGGGSTELIIGQELTPLELESVQMGCVDFSERYFPEGRCSAKRMARARLAARLQLEPIHEAYRRRGWDQAIGSSGTVKAIGDAIRELDPTATCITADGLQLLLDELLAVDNVQDLDLKSLSSERRALMGGGLAILAEIFDVLDIKEMQIAEGAMREGLLYDMVGRLTEGEDARDRTVAAMQARYHVDLDQAARVEATALELLAQVAESWNLQHPIAARALAWAAKLHEIGLDVAHSRYHQHGAYLLEHADMPGFPREEQQLLAQLVGCHRRKLHLDGLERLLPEWQTMALRLIVLLRLAALVHRGRSSAPAPAIAIEASGSRVVLRFPRGWLRAHPLTMADLMQEVDYLRAQGIRLQVFSRGQTSAVLGAGMAPAA